MSSANAESLEDIKILFSSWFPLNSIAQYLVPTRYSKVLSAAEIWIGDGFCKNWDSIDTGFETSGLVITAEKLILLTRCWYPWIC